MIQILANKITEQLFDNGEARDIYEIHKYGIEITISTTVNFLLLVLIGYISNYLIDACLYFLLFGFIRKFSGGYHCSTYFKCISLHVSLFIIYVITENVYYDFRLLIFVFTYLIFLYLSPIELRNLNNSEISLYRIISLIIISVLMITSFFINHVEIIVYVLFVVSILMLVCIKEK